jgi:hypothetical protein
MVILTINVTVQQGNRYKHRSGPKTSIPSAVTSPQCPHEGRQRAEGRGLLMTLEAKDQDLAATQTNPNPKWFLIAEAVYRQKCNAGMRNFKV